LFEVLANTFLHLLPQANEGGGGVVGVTWVLASIFISNMFVHLQQALSFFHFISNFYFKAPSFIHFVSKFYFKHLLFRKNLCFNKHDFSHISSPSFFLNTFF
jgi:hypothetical protein